MVWSNDLANDFVGADIVVFGARLGWPRSPGLPCSRKELEQLEISLFAEAELFGCFGGSGPHTLAVDEHQEPGDEDVIWPEGRALPRGR